MFNSSTLTLYAEFSFVRYTQMFFDVYSFFVIKKFLTIKYVNEATAVSLNEHY
jgi:hypothetical protein